MPMRDVLAAAVKNAVGREINPDALTVKSHLAGNSMKEVVATMICSSGGCVLATAFFPVECDDTPLGEVVVCRVD